MSAAREQIFAALRAGSPPDNRHDREPDQEDPARLPWPPMPENAVQVFRARLEEAGGAFEIANGEDWTVGTDWPIAPTQAAHVYSECDALPSRGIGQQVPLGPAEPSAFRNEALRELAPLNLCVLKGIFGVVENGAVWHVPANPAVRAAALLAEHLVLILDAASLVPSLHQAYERIDLQEAPFGWFLCGPSKTADIEQALVYGAHGPKTMRLILQESLETE